MGIPGLLNPRDFDHLTKGDQEYLESIERLYLLNGGHLDHFRPLGPWHCVNSHKLGQIVYRLATPTQRPCSRGHTAGLWCLEDLEYVTGKVVYKHKSQDVERSEVSSLSNKSKNHSRLFTIPRQSSPKGKVPKPTPWLIVDPNTPKAPLGLEYTLEMASKSPHSQSQRSQPAPKTSRTQTASATSRTLITPRSSRTPRKFAKSTERSYVSSPHESVSSEELNKIISRITKPTSASRGGVDLQAKFENKDHVYGSQSVTPEELDVIVRRMTKPTVASTGGAGKERSYTDFVYGDKQVEPERLDEIIERIRKPTASSLGGGDLVNKEFVYIQPSKVKTNIIIPGVAKRYLGMKKTSREELNAIAERLNRLTPAYKAKYSPNPHVWVDDSKKGPAHTRQLTVA
ncbi:hypothetical protein CHS0354_033455 [Potamilus streckersoni]|uniref:Uncharacterized protein n=1 Tax=Potamilus streckersoni TaxID=2493646 RepID=A0AAE0SGV8_9BIVA|nr:hypothetical protein CHS0354_033455 [Potamilus streckersoni]